MKKIFLHARHWQVFLALMLIPLGFQMIFVETSLNFTLPDAGELPDLSPLVTLLNYVPLVTALGAFVIYGWMWAVVSSFKEKVPVDAHLSYARFTVLFAFVVLYCMVIVVGLHLFISYYLADLLASTIEPTDAEMRQYIRWVLLAGLMHFVATVCTFYCIWYTAKTLKTIEMDRDAYGSELAGYFFLLWFFPIGIWLIQPVVNRIAAQENSVLNETL